MRLFFAGSGSTVRGRRNVGVSLFGDSLALAILPLVFAALALAAAPPAESEAGLAAGPMVGYSTLREVALWVQTDGPAEVEIRYWPQDQPGQIHRTARVETTRRDAYTAKLIADEVEPGTVYDYAVWLDGQAVEVSWDLRFRTQTLWRHREAPPDFTVAAGSCAYINEPAYDRPGDPYGGGYEIFQAIHRLGPEMMIWLGDNVYLREADWSSRTGILARYTHDRATAELQPLLGSVHHYATWDDHDAGPNNTHRSLWNRATVEEAFRLFWPNPGFGVPGVSGVTTFAQWGDIDFFLLDNRSHRIPNERRTIESSILGEAQIQWLLDGLAASRAPFKIVAVGGQVINPAAGYETYAHIAPAERDRLLRLIRLERITGVVFLTGDRHHTEVTRLAEWGHPPIYELTFSPLTAGAHTDAADEPNFLRIPETLVTQRNFGLLRFSGPYGERVLEVSSHDATGKELWRLAIPQSEVETPLPRRTRGGAPIAPIE